MEKGIECDRLMKRDICGALVREREIYSKTKRDVKRETNRKRFVCPNVQR